MFPAKSIKLTPATNHAPFMRAISLVSVLGLVIGLLIARTTGDAPANPAPVYSMLNPGQVHSAKTATQWTEWRWASEEGVHFIEYTWKPRHPAPVPHPSAIVEASVLITHAYENRHLP